MGYISLSAEERFCTVPLRFRTEATTLWRLVESANLLVSHNIYLTVGFVKGKKF